MYTVVQAKVILAHFSIFEDLISSQLGYSDKTLCRKHLELFVKYKPVDVFPMESVTVNVMTPVESWDDLLPNSWVIHKTSENVALKIQKGELGYVKLSGRVSITFQDLFNEYYYFKDNHPTLIPAGKVIQDTIGAPK